MALIVNAANEFIRRTSNIPAATAFTAMGWARIIDNSFNDFCELRNGSGVISDFSGDNVNLVLYNGSTTPTVIATPANGTRIHWYMRCSGTGANLLSAGAAAISSASYSTQTSTLVNTATGTQLTIGGNAFDPSGHAFGPIKVWDAHLSDAEIALERWVAHPVRTANLNAWYHTNDPGTLSNNYNDNSGNGNHCTATGTLTFEANPPIYPSSRRPLTYLEL